MEVIKWEQIFMPGLKVKIKTVTVKFLYYKLYNLAYEISDYEGNCLNVYDMRLVFWFDN